MFVRTKTTGLVLDERPYIGSVTPPAALSDRSRWKNNGVHTNITWVQLPSGLWVRSFNGVNSWVNCGNNASLKAATTITVEAWINSDLAAVGADVIVASSSGWQTGYNTEINNDTTISFYYNLNGTSYRVTTGITTRGTWIHTASVFQDITHEYIYLNGVLASGGISSFVTAYLFHEVIIGALALAYSNSFQGFIALCRIYNYALSAQQIRKRFEATRHWFNV